MPPRTETQTCFALQRRCWAKRILLDIDERKTTGPDHLPGLILKKCARVLDLPVILLARRMVAEGEWPECWRTHWIHPIFKSGAVSNPEKYRGVHLTCILSKAIERVVAVNFAGFLHSAQIYGQSQWAFRPNHSCRDLIALAIARWIRALYKNERVGIYLSDISAAFDRVPTPVLLEKLSSVGVSPEMLRFLESYLRERRAAVLVEGKNSVWYTLANMIFQGTVLGPPLWNVYFADVSSVIPEGFDESKFADDLKVDKCFPKDTDNDFIFGELNVCQRRVHEWGVRNQAIFDRSKEHFVILDNTDPAGEVFKMLGTWIDGKLSMKANTAKILAKARPKVASLLRSRPFYSVASMITQYKTHVLGLLEMNVGGFYHACDTVLSQIDQVQTSYLHKLSISAAEAFLDYNLAPLSTRRDIAMLGLVYKCVFDLAHPDLCNMFTKINVGHEYLTRLQDNRHRYQLKEETDGTRHEMLRRSIFGAVRIWNRLPQNIVEIPCVSKFQSALTELVRCRCRGGGAQWEETLSPRVVLTSAHEGNYFVAS